MAIPLSKNSARKSSREPAKFLLRVKAAQRLQSRNRLSGCRLAVDPGRDTLRLFEVARVLVRFDHVARFIINANHSAM